MDKSVIIYIISYLIEKISPLRLYLLWWNLRQKKNAFMAHGAANIAAIIYFVTNIIVLYKDLREFPTDPEGYSFYLWLIIIMPLTLGFRKIHLKITPIDPDRDNIDFSD